MGVILHGSRSGRAGQPNEAGRHTEFVGTAQYAVNEPGGLGWNATVGHDEIAIHMLHSQWGWNARAASNKYLGVEFAQPTEAWPITDGQVRAFCWFVKEARKTWSHLPLQFPTHAELDGTQIYGGQYDGKTDVFRRGSPATDDLRARILAQLGLMGVK